MKNKVIWILFVIMLLLAAGCSFSPEYNLQGTWEADISRYRFDENTYTIEGKVAVGVWVLVQKGTFSADGKTITFKPKLIPAYEVEYSLSFNGKTLTIKGIEYTKKG
ncbi:MAG: hypothetical protein LBQ77_01365 [Treponema sp.]|jgi:hypothetical protein|nr:hypothetical protein [Treponema sp.]